MDWIVEIYGLDEEVIDYWRILDTDEKEAREMAERDTKEQYPKATRWTIKRTGARL